MIFTPKNKKHKKLFFKILYSIALTITSYPSKAQFFNSDQNPPSLKWRQLDAGNFRILYPSQFETEAQRMAATIQKVLPYQQQTIRKKPYYISIIMQNQGVVSNGFVQLAPRRSEFYTTPSQNFDYQDWLNSLVVHEMRHVVQFDKLSGNLRRPFLESLGLAIFGVTLPPWFYEGDAVNTETSLSRAGRGRIPEWSLNLRSSLLDGKTYSYSKDFLDSYRDFTPGYYQLGYYLTNKLRRDHGPLVVDSILQYIKQNPLRPYSLSRAIRKISGLNTRALHDSTISELRNRWIYQNQILKSEHYTSLNLRKDSIPANYQVPLPTEDGKLLAICNSKAVAPAVVEVDQKGNVKRLFGIGVQETPWMSYAQGKIVWDETRYDGRFQKRSYSVICLFDRHNNRRRQLTYRSRYFAPALSADGHRIAAIEIDQSNKVHLVILNASNGERLLSIESPNQVMLQTPCFNLEGNKITMIGLGMEGKSILEFNLASKTFTPLLPSQLQDLQRPSYIGDNILFKAHYNGIDNIYKLTPNSGNIEQLTNSDRGLYYPFYDTITQRIVANTHTSKGHDLTALNYADLKPQAVQRAPVGLADLNSPIEEQEHFAKPMDSIPHTNFPSKPYRELSNLFYAHSIIPIAKENEFFDNYNFGFELQSNNLLNTTSAYAQYRFNNYLRKSEYLAGISYSRYLPVLSVEYTNQARMISRRVQNNGATTYIPVSWREHEVEASIRIPLSFNHFNHYYSASLLTSTSYTSRYDIENGMASLVKRLQFPMRYRLGLSHTIRRSGRDLAPALGQSLILNYRNFPFENRVTGDLLTLESHLYFPGIMQNHSFQANFNYRQGSGAYVNNLNIPLAKGYSYLRHQQPLINTLLFDYRFPIAYPDREIGDFAYVKRIKAGLFSDFENVGHSRFSPRSFGAELRADMNLLRFYLPVFDVGARFIMLNQATRGAAFELMATYSY